MDNDERLATLTAIMRWNVANAKRSRELNTADGHRDCERMLANARQLLAQIMELEGTTNANE